MSQNIDIKTQLLSIPHFRIRGGALNQRESLIVSFQFLILGYEKGHQPLRPLRELSIPHFRIREGGGRKVVKPPTSFQFLILGYA